MRASPSAASVSVSVRVSRCCSTASSRLIIKISTIAYGCAAFVLFFTPLLSAPLTNESASAAFDDKGQAVRMSELIFVVLINRLKASASDHVCLFLFVGGDRGSSSTERYHCSELIVTRTKWLHNCSLAKVILPRRERATKKKKKGVKTPSQTYNVCVSCIKFCICSDADPAPRQCAPVCSRHGKYVRSPHVRIRGRTAGGTPDQGGHHQSKRCPSGAGGVFLGVTRLTQFNELPRAGTR